jgi:hypothetical protein
MNVMDVCKPSACIKKVWVVSAGKRQNAKAPIKAIVSWLTLLISV